MENNEKVPEFGQKIQPEAAKAFVDGLYDKMYARWDKKVTQAKFMKELSEGDLPLDVMKLFWKNWYVFVSEINPLIGSTYQKHGWFFKQHADLYAAFSGKVADEVMSPRPPGHILIVMEQGKEFGLTEQEMIHCHMLPECRALLEWFRGLLYEGTMVEWWAALAPEELMGHWSKECRKALTEKYGFKPKGTEYFRVHQEADLETHEQGIIGHGELNRLALQRLLEEGHAMFRPGFDLEYCNLTTVDYLAMFFDGAYKHALEGEYDMALAG
jgi:pyrroloquinoline quinone (PQQ) biosynthesis protein C